MSVCLLTIDVVMDLYVTVKTTLCDWLALQVFILFIYYFVVLCLHFHVIACHCICLCVDY